jgi:hypothetical protein
MVMMAPDLINAGTGAGLRYKARRLLTIDGTTYQPGEGVPIWAIPPEKLDRWVETRTIVIDRVKPAAEATAMSGPGEVNPPAEGKAAKPAKEAAAPCPGGIPGGEAIEGERDSYIQHIGRGWYAIYHLGQTGKERTAAKAGEKLREMRGPSWAGVGASILDGNGGGGDGEKAGLAPDRLPEGEPEHSGELGGDPGAGEANGGFPLDDGEQDAPVTG